MGEKRTTRRGRALMDGKEGSWTHLLIQGKVLLHDLEASKQGAVDLVPVLEELGIGHTLPLGHEANETNDSSKKTAWCQDVNVNPTFLGRRALHTTLRYAGPAHTSTLFLPVPS